MHRYSAMSFAVGLPSRCIASWYAAVHFGRGSPSRLRQWLNEPSSLNCGRPFGREMYADTDKLGFWGFGVFLVVVHNVSTMPW